MRFVLICLGALALAGVAQAQTLSNFQGRMVNCLTSIGANDGHGHSTAYIGFPNQFPVTDVGEPNTGGGGNAFWIGGGQVREVSWGWVANSNGTLDHAFTMGWLPAPAHPEAPTTALRSTTAQCLLNSADVGPAIVFNSYNPGKFKQSGH